jgi:predicted GIY-YIG superfamily endonuclease
MADEKSIENLKRYEMPKTGVYFLFDQDSLIYIGKSENVFRRLNDHIRNKFFNNYSFIKCNTEEDASRLEKELIIKYKPALNIQHKKEELIEREQYLLQWVEHLLHERDLYGLNNEHNHFQKIKDE